MNGSGRVRRRRFFLWLAPVVLASIALPAGRSDAAEETVSANTVAEGLKTIERAGAEIAEYAGEDKDKAQSYVTRITPVWGMIEGTIRANDNDAYVAIEKAIGGLEAAASADDGAEAESALKALAEAVKTYSPPPSAAAPAPAKGGRSAAAATPTPAPAKGGRSAAAATPTPAPAAAPAAAAEAGDAALARTGTMSNALAALAGLALTLGGLAVIGGAPRRAARVV